VCVDLVVVADVGVVVDVDGAGAVDVGATIVESG